MNKVDCWKGTISSILFSLHHHIRFLTGLQKIQGLHNSTNKTTNHRFHSNKHPWTAVHNEGRGLWVLYLGWFRRWFQAGGAADLRACYVQFCLGCCLEEPAPALAEQALQTRPLEGLSASNKCECPVVGPRCWMYGQWLRSELEPFHHWSLKKVLSSSLALETWRDVRALCPRCLMYTISSVFKHDHVIDSQIDLLMLIQVFHVLITAKKLIKYVSRAVVRSTNDMNKSTLIRIQTLLLG